MSNPCPVGDRPFPRAPLLTGSAGVMLEGWGEMTAGPCSFQPLSSSFFPLSSPFLILPVGAQQPEGFIGYFTTACVVIVLAIFSYILLPRMVRPCCPGGEGCGNMGPLHTTAQGLWPTGTPALAQPLPSGSGQALLRELSGVLRTSDTPVSLWYCGNGPLGEQESISIRRK